MKNLWILAQAEGEQAGGDVTGQPIDQAQDQTQTTTQQPADVNAPGKQQKPQSMMSTIILFGLMFVVLYFMLFRGPKKQQQKHKQMIQSLEKNDKVRTIGGVYGTIVDIRENEVVLKVDESNNTKIRLAISAINRNLSKEPEK